MNTPYLDGAMALYRGYELEENPYDPLVNPDAYNQWAAGWRSAAREVESA